MTRSNLPIEILRISSASFGFKGSLTPPIETLRVSAHLIRRASPATFPVKGKELYLIA